MDKKENSQSLSEIFSSADPESEEFAVLFVKLLDYGKNFTERLIVAKFESKSRMIVSRVGTRTDIAVKAVEDLLLERRNNVEARFTTGQLFKYVSEAARRIVLGSVRIKCSIAGIADEYDPATFRELTPAEKLEFDEHLDAFEAFRLELEDKHPHVYQVFYLHAFEKKSFVQIGKMIGKSDKTAAKRFVDAMDLLRANGFSGFADSLAHGSG